MRTKLRALAAVSMLTGLLGVTIAGPAVATPFAAGGSAAQECTLVQSEIYTGANTFGYSQGLEGCAGDVTWEILGSNSSSGPFEVVDSGSTHYDNEVVSHWEDSSTMPCHAKITARYGDQEITTRVAQNNNCSG